MKKILSIALAAAATLLFAGYGMPEVKPTANKAKSIADAKSHFTRLGTNKIHYLTVGKGKQTILFVHGWAGNAGFWSEQVPAFADKARLILIDLPGHGKSDKPQTDYTLDYFSEGVLAVMRDAKVDKAVLVGHSMGTPVICGVHARAPEKVAALVAVDGTLRKPKMTSEQIEQFVGPYRTPEYREHAARFVDFMFPNPGTEKMRDWCREEMLKTPQHVMVSAMDGMFDPGKPGWDLKKVTVPVLSINADNPMWTDDYKGYVRSLSPQADYRAIENTGHFIAQERPAEFNAALTDTLQKCGLLTK